jgi:16S rRNA processing protein RimM
MKQDTHTSPAERLIALGEIVGTHGVRGLVRFQSYGRAASALPTDRPVYLTARPAPGSQPDTRDARLITVETVHPHGSVCLLRVTGIDDIDAAAALVGRALALPEHDLPEPEPGAYYVYQLPGLAVVTEDGERIGTIDSSFSNGANEVLVVRDGDREYLIPLIADVVRGVDLDSRRVVIQPIAGLLDS